MIVCCPKCRDEVSLPARIIARAIVRCPLCEERYELSEALAAVPPALEIVEVPEGALVGAGVESASLLNAYAQEHTYKPASESFGEDVELQGSSFAAATVDAEPETETEASSETTFETAPRRDREFKASPGMKRSQPSGRRKKKAGNPIMELVKVVAGGAMAVPLTLLLLLWLPGTWKRDPFELEPKIKQYAPWALPGHYSGASTTPSPLAPADKGSGTNTAIDPKTQLAANNTPPAATEKTAKESDPFAQALKSGNVEFGPGTANPAEEKPAVEEPMLVDPAAVAPADPKMKLPENPAEQPPVKPAGKEPELGIPEPPENVAMPESPELIAARLALQKADADFDAATAGDKTAMRTLYTAAADFSKEMAAGENPAKAEDFRSLLLSPAKIQLAGAAANSWFEKKGPPNGIILSGLVKECKMSGSVYEITLELPSKDKKTITVLAPSQFAAETNVFAAGRIVENAARDVAGYQGAAEKAVDARYVEEISVPK